MKMDLTAAVIPQAADREINVAAFSVFKQGDPVNQRAFMLLFSPQQGG